MSNPIPSQYHHRVVQVVGVSGATMVAAQSVDAAADNTIAIHNVVAASARLGVMWRRGLVPRRTVIPTIFSWCWPAR